MLTLLSLVAGLAGLATPPAAGPAKLCGGDDRSLGDVSMTLRFLDFPADLHSPYVNVLARGGDGAYTFLVGYRPTKDGLGKPHTVFVNALIRFGTEAEVRPVRLEWHAPGEAWSTPMLWSNPQRLFPKEESRYRADYRLAQGAPFPHGTDVLDQLAKGVRYEFRNLDEAGLVLGTGASEFPPSKVVERMYASARKAALARLKPCDAGRAPPIVPVAPPATANRD